jgi:hypothetical protein
MQHGRSLREDAIMPFVTGPLASDIADLMTMLVRVKAITVHAPFRFYFLNSSGERSGVKSTYRQPLRGAHTRRKLVRMIVTRTRAERAYVIGIWGVEVEAVSGVRRQIRPETVTAKMENASQSIRGSDND